MTISIGTGQIVEEIGVGVLVLQGTEIRAPVENLRLHIDADLLQLVLNDGTELLVERFILNRHLELQLDPVLFEDAITARRPAQFREERLGEFGIVLVEGFDVPCNSGRLSDRPYRGLPSRGAGLDDGPSRRRVEAPAHRPHKGEIGCG